MSACVSSYHLCYLALVEVDSRWQVGDRNRQKRKQNCRKKWGSPASSECESNLDGIENVKMSQNGSSCVNINKCVDFIK